MGKHHAICPNAAEHHADGRADPDTIYGFRGDDTCYNEVSEDDTPYVGRHRHNITLELRQVYKPWKYGEFVRVVRLPDDFGHGFEVETV